MSDLVVLADLVVHAGSADVAAAVRAPDGTTIATGHRTLPRHEPETGWVEHAPEEVWRAVLDAARDALAQVDVGSLRGVRVTNHPDTVVLWDRDTLGSPRRAIAGADRRTAEICARLRAAGHEDRVAELTGLTLDPSYVATRLTWLAEHEPHTWALVVSGRYAVGTVDSYLVARMTRGLEHVTDLTNASRTLLLDRSTGDWSLELCEVFGVPLDALPELVTGPGEIAVTDPRTFLDLEVPVTGLSTG